MTTPTNIHLSVRRWHDRVNGNSYFAARVYADGIEVARLPFQYGYGSQPDATALVDSRDALPVLATAKHSAYLGSACRELGIAFTEDDVAGCLKRDVKAHGKAEVSA